MPLIRFFISQRLFMNLLSIFLIGLGYYSLTSLNRERFPVVELDLVVITAIYPGASPDEMESLVTDRIEDKLKEADGIKELDSYSIDNRIGVVATLEPDLYDRRAVVDDIRRLVDSIRDFPLDMEEPIVTEINSRKRAIGTVVIASKQDSNNYRKLREKARFLEDGIKELEGVAEIKKNGYFEREFRVELEPEKMQRYGVGVDQIFLAIASRNTEIPIGSVKQGGREIILKTPGKVRTAEEIGNIVVQANEEGHVVYLKQVAKVSDDFTTPLILTRVDGRQAITMTIFKKYRHDTIDTIENIQKFLHTSLQGEKAKKEFVVRIISNSAQRIKTRIQVLSSNAYIGIGLVLVALFVFLSWRIALITAVGIPLAFSITFIFMKLLHYNLDLLTLLGLIVVVGMIVDDAIIVAENIYRYIEAGLDPQKAAIKGASEVIMPVAATILTSIAAFTPLLLMSGVRGKFSFFIAIVVILALSASWLESMLTLPAHVADFGGEKPKQPSKFRFYADKFFLSMRDFYVRVLRLALRFKYFVITTMLVFLFVSIAAIISGNLAFVPFPRDGIERFIFACKAPLGTELYETERRVRKVENFLTTNVKKASNPNNPKPDEELLSFRSLLGAIQSRPGSRYSEYSSSYAVVFADLTGHNTRKRKGTAIIKDLNAKLASQIDPSYIDCKIKKSLFGASTKGSIELQVVGDNLLVLQKITDEITKAIAVPNPIYTVDDNIEREKSVMRIEVPQSTLAVMGLNNQVLNNTLRTVFEGSTPAALRLDGEEVKVRLIFPEEKRNHIDSLQSVYLSNQRGMLVPISRIIRVTEDKSAAKIIHKNWKQTLTVFVDPQEKGTSARSVVNLLREKILPIQKKYPSYSITFAGSYKEEKDVQNELLNSFYIALLFIFLILITLFKSVFQPIMVMVAIPLGFIGAVVATLAHGIPMSFMGGIGFIGLVGVVVNDSLVMVEFINKAIQETWQSFLQRCKTMERAEFKELMVSWKQESSELVIEGAKLRFRPVLLTTITTFFGLIPTAYGIGGDDPYIKPLAIVFAWGLIFATINTLLVIPAIYLSYLPARLRFSYLLGKIFNRSE
ncbi:MAG: efflux RND transporter permease subunit [Spirochaetota bacterium]